MVKDRYPGLRGIACFIGALAGAILLAGCGAKSQDAAPKTETPAVESTAASAPADFAALIAKINASGDMIAWHAARAEYLAGGATSPEADAALAAKEQELLAKTPAQPVNESLELLAFQWKLAGETSAEGKLENFNATWLFRAKQDIQLPPGIEVKLVLRGWPDKAHQHYLKEAGHKEIRYFEKTYDFEPSLGEWKAGSYNVMERLVKPPVPNVPYRMHTIYSQVKQNEDGTGTSFAGPYSELTDMGWFVDLGE